MRCLFGVSVWGQPYIDNFLKLALPMHMGPGNLEGLPSLDHCLYLIYTREEDIDYLKSQPQIQALQAMMRVEFSPIQLDQGSKYDVLGRLQAATLGYAAKHDFEAVFVLYSDLLYSTGTFSNSVRRLSQRFQAVVSLGPQAVAGPLTKELLTGRFSHCDHALAVPPRALVDIVFRNLHPFHAPSFWDFGKFTNVPSLIFWRVPGQGVLAHGFHLHPVALAVRKDSQLFGSSFYGTLDEHFMPLLFDSADMVHIVNDSDEMFMCSMDEIRPDGRGEIAEGEPSVGRVARWAEHHAYLLHRDMVHVGIRMHTVDLDMEQWRPQEEFARGIIARVMSRLGTSEETLSLEDPQAVVGRKYHRKILKEIHRALELPNASTQSLVAGLVRRSGSGRILSHVFFRIVILILYLLPGYKARAAKRVQDYNAGSLLARSRLWVRQRYYEKELQALPLRTLFRELTARIFLTRRFTALFHGRDRTS